MNRQLEFRATEPGIPAAFDSVQYAEDEAHIDVAAILRDVWSAVYRNRLLVLAVTGLCILLGVVATMLATPKYRATTSIQIDQEASKVLGTEETLPVAAYQDTARFLQTQIDVLTSRTIAEQVMTRLNLASSDNFPIAMGVKPVSNPGSLTPQEARRQQVLGLIGGNLTVELPPNSRVAEISFRSPNPQLAQQIANSVAENFIMMNLKRRFDQTAYARNFLQQQLVSAKQRLEDSERAALEYASSVNLIDASAGVASGESGANANGPRSLVTSDLVSLNSAYASARANRVAAQQRWEQAQRTPINSLPEVLGNPAISTLTQQRAQLYANFAQEKQRHREDYPALRQMSAQINNLDMQIAGIKGDVRNSIRDQYATAVKQEQALSGNVATLKNETLAEQQRSVRYNILKRETDTNRTMYDGLLQRYKELSAEAGVSSNNVSIVDRAEVPTIPVSPRPLVNLALAGMMGLLLSAGLVFVREKFDDAVRSPDDVAKKLGLTLLNTVPMLPIGETPMDALSQPRSSITEAYAALRTSLELVDPRGLPSVLLFTSTRPAEGKSTSAYAVARDFARLGKKVILIDSDLRRPSLHRLLALPNTGGLASVLAQHRKVEDVVNATDTPGLTFLSAGPLPPNPAELLSGDSLKTLLSSLRDQYELIVIDGPPVLGLADAVILASNAEGTIFVVEANGSHHGHTKAALRRLRGGNARLLGALLTKYDAKKIGYGYSYGYYSYDYGREVK